MIENLSAREKKLISVALGIIICMILWSVLKQIPAMFEPSLRAQVEEKREAFENIIPKLVQLKKLKQSRHEYSDFSNSSLYKFITENKPKLNVDNNDEMIITEVNKAVQLQFKAVSFDDLVRWLEQLHKQHGVSVEAAEIVAIADSPGYVATTLIIQ